MKYFSIGGLRLFASRPKEGGLPATGLVGLEWTNDSIVLFMVSVLSDFVLFLLYWVGGENPE